MPAAVSAPTTVTQGATVDFVATGFATTHAISLAITGADESFILHDAATTDGSGNYTWSAEVTFEALGIATWSITDGTATKTGTIQVVTD